MSGEDYRLSPADLAERCAVQRQALAFRLQCRLDVMAELGMESVGISKGLATELIQALTGEAPANSVMSGLISHDDSRDVVPVSPAQEELQVQIHRLQAAPAESERKRVDLMAALKPFSDLGEFLLDFDEADFSLELPGGYPLTMEPFRAAHALLARLTPTPQETTHVEG